MAHDLGLGDDYLATRLEVVSGRFTGGLIEPPCYGAGKVVLARAYSAQHNLNLAASYFYTDSHHDLPLLESVGKPIVVNPNRKLKAIALERCWRQERFLRQGCKLHSSYVLCRNRVGGVVRLSSRPDSVSLESVAGQMRTASLSECL